MAVQGRPLLPVFCLDVSTLWALFCFSTCDPQELDAERREFESYKERESASKSKKSKGKKSRE